MSQPKRFVGFVLLWLTILFGGWSQSSPPDLYFKHYFEKFSITNISSIVQDTSGFVWIGTAAGLNRFDGLEFSIFEASQSDTTSLTDNRINDLMIDRQGRLWIATYQDLMWYDHATNHFRVVDRFDDPVLEIDALTLEEDQQGAIWIGTLHGLYQTNNSFQHLIRPGDHYARLNEMQINDLFFDKQDHLWIGTNHQLIKTDHQQQQVILDEVEVTAISQLGQSIWVGTRSKGLFQLSITGEIMDQFHLAGATEEGNSNRIFDILPDSQGLLWVGTEIGGLQLYQPGLNQFYAYYKGLDEGSLKSNSVWEVFEDRSGRIWLGTNNQGVFVHDENYSKFEQVTPQRGQTQQLKFGTVSAFLPVSKGLWIGTDGGGVSVYDSITGKFDFFDKTRSGGSLGSDEVLTMYQDSEEDIWVGNWGGGLNRYEAKQQHFQTYLHDDSDPQSIGSDNVFAIREDQEGGIWCTTWGKGLSRLDKTSGAFSHIGYEAYNPNYLSSDLTYDLEIDSDGNLWVATVLGLDKVILFADTFRVTHFTHNPEDPTSLSSLNVNSILIDSRERIWVGTKFGLNILQSENEGFERFFKEDGLSDNDIKSVTEDDQGDFWVATGNGLTKVSNKNGQWIFEVFDESDGILSREFFNNASLKTSTGELFLGGLNGFNHFYPEHVTMDQHAPRVHFTDFKLFNRTVKPGPEAPITSDINHSDKMMLNHRQSVFTIEYLAIHFTHAEKNQFAYQLEGFETAWNYVGSLKQATYTNLDAGIYTFKVKAANHDGVWGKERHLTIEVLPPWWETFWFRFLVGFGLISVLLSVFWLRVSFLKAQRSKLQSEVERQTKELKSTNEELQRLGKFKEVITGMLVHDLKNPLHLILGLSDQKKDKDLREINLSGRRMLYMVSNMLDVQKFEETSMKLDKTSIDLNRLVEETLHQFELILKSKSLRFVNQVANMHALGDVELLGRVLQNLFSNAAKYTPYGGTITISAKEQDERIVIEVTDTGEGIAEKDRDRIFEKFHQADPKKLGDTSSTGLGLTFCKMVITAHEGIIGVRSKLGEGATFYFDIARSSQIGTARDKMATEALQEDLSPEELTIIRSITPTLANLRLYEVSKIESLVNSIEETEQIKQWKSALKTAAYHWDEERYQKLTSI
ncbi:MAG: two-component regulator propeller domain-containing protein [Cytophagales bacterium]|nr:two-component regulator propeller domain-containing protein [Cytophagales bacterium]